jgi:hypothetical protein
MHSNGSGPGTDPASNRPDPAHGTMGFRDPDRGGLSVPARDHEDRDLLDADDAQDHPY